MLLLEKIKQILALRQDVDEMRKQMRVMEDEWQDWFDRFKRLHARIARRQQRDEQAPSGEDTQPGGERGAPMSTLSPRAQQIQREILAERMRRKPNGGQ
jgi:hypothetical protein